MEIGAENLTDQGWWRVVRERESKELERAKRMQRERER
jgi:hypothetical protein